MRNPSEMIIFLNQSMKTYIIQNNSVIDEEKKILSQNYQELGGKTLNKHNPEDY